MFVGIVRLGDTVGPVFESRLSTLAPAAADALPTFRVYDGTTLLLTGTTAAFDAANVTGAYRAAVVASSGNGFARGRTYTVVGSWTVNGGEARQEIATFLCS